METTKTLNELLVRFDDDGKFQGAHAVYLYRTVDPDTGKRVTASLGGPTAIAKASEADRAKLVAVVGEALVALAEAKEAAEAKAREHETTIAAKDAELVAKDAVAQELLEQAEVAEKRAQDYARDLTALRISAGILVEEPALVEEPVPAE
jgi:hypothetical protein